MTTLYLIPGFGYRRRNQLRVLDIHLGIVWDLFMGTEIDLSFSNTPEFALDQISWANLESFLKDFAQAGTLFVQNIIAKDVSYVVITSPNNYQNVYAQKDAEGNWIPVTVKWKAIDKLNTVVNHTDFETIFPITVSITRIFSDSDSNLIQGTVTPNVIDIS